MKGRGGGMVCQAARRMTLVPTNTDRKRYLKNGSSLGRDSSSLVMRSHPPPTLCCREVRVLAQRQSFVLYFSPTRALPVQCPISTPFHTERLRAREMFTHKLCGNQTPHRRNRSNSDSNSTSNNNNSSSSNNSFCSLNGVCSLQE